jgi:hypothetical protein
MKKQVFTLLIMLVLVALTGKTFAQSTPTAPWEGATVNYVVNGLTEGDGYTFGINTAENAFVTGGSYYTVIAGGSGTVGADGRATFRVEWNAGSADAGLYYVWIQIQDYEAATPGCYTYRYITVDPMDAQPYTVDYSIVALIAGDETTDAGDITSLTGDAAVRDCPAFVDESFESTTSGAGSATDGNSYVFFRIRREAADLPNTSWAITPTSSSTVVGWTYSTDNAATFGGYTMGVAITPITTGNDIYLRAEVQNGTTSQDITVAIAGGNDINMIVETVGYQIPSATLTLDPLPAVGTFGDSN